MKWPWFVSRFTFDQVLGDKNKRIADLEKECHRLHDLIYSTNLGIQIYDSIPIVAVAEVSEEKLTPEQELEQEHQRETDARNLRLTSLKRTSPSRMGSAIARELMKETERRAGAAHPAHPSHVVFAQARKEANG